MTIVTLFSWATPAFINNAPMDHTWVTTYDIRKTVYNNISQVISAGEHAWYCWGNFHPTGKFLGSKSGNLQFARCLVASNSSSNSNPPACGTIFTYGIDGVCHQLANQVLYATGPAPLTVSKARWYLVSTFLYGTYGLQTTAWANKIATCKSTGATLTMKASPGSPKGAAPTAATDDAFARHARATLRHRDADALKALLELRQTIHASRSEQSAAMQMTAQTPTAEELNKRNRQFIKQAADLLGKDKFIQVFGFSPDETVDLVDPDQMPGSALKL